MERLELRLQLDAAGLLNGAFDVADPQDAQFGWQLVGDASVVAGQGVLAENPAELSEFLQTFSLPAGSERLRFTIHHASLHPNPADPPDAFEVALLDAATNLPLLSTAQGLPATDALLNLNGNGRLYFGPAVSVAGGGASGDIAALNYPVTVEVDVHSIPSGTEVTLYFDLLSSGGVDAQVTIDDVQLLGNLAPPLTLAIDPSTDSGSVGDVYTNLPVVHLVGFTEPGATVELDLDGDGFDDGATTADGGGQYRFDTIPLGNGNNPMAARATGAHGSTEIRRSFHLDDEAVTGALEFPIAGSIFEEDPGFVAVRWTDTESGPAGGSYDTGDVTVTGVDVDRIEVLENGLVRYWYSDDGQSLPWGRITVTQPEATVSDRAGNGNAVRSDTFARLPLTCLWRNPDQREDVSNDHLVTPRDALLVINFLNEFGSKPVSPTPAVPDVPPPFLDTSCNFFVTPLDALIVINYLNARAGGEGEIAWMLDNRTSDDSVLQVDRPDVPAPATVRGFGSAAFAWNIGVPDRVTPPPRDEAFRDWPNLDLGLDELVTVLAETSGQNPFDDLAVDVG